MNFSKWISTVDTHTEGQPTRIVTGGIGRLPGKTMVEKMEYFQANLDEIRTLLINEPRGHHDMYGCVLTDPCSERADFGVFFMDNSGYMNMCGHATIGVCTALLETGMVPAQEPFSRVALETPGGIVEAMVTFREGRAEKVCFRNVAAYVEYLDATLAVPGLGDLKVDVAYGGNYFVFFSGEEAGLRIEIDNVKAIIDTSMRIREAGSEANALIVPVSTLFPR